MAAVQHIVLHPCTRNTMVYLLVVAAAARVPLTERATLTANFCSVSIVVYVYVLASDMQRFHLDLLLSTACICYSPSN